MIELIFKDNTQRQFFDNFDSIEISDDVVAIQCIDFGEKEQAWMGTQFSIDLSILTRVDDIEISSHYYNIGNQLSLQFALPCINESSELSETSLTIIMIDDKIISFLQSALEKSFMQLHSSKKYYDTIKMNTVQELFVNLIAIFSDYYADLTELIAKRIKNIAEKILRKKEFSASDLDLITELNFDNIMIKESINEYQRILMMIKKDNVFEIAVQERIGSELNDLVAVKEYIQYNFDRLDDLKDNVSNKIDLEQNRIFKILTIVTVCIAIPTFIAGVYGMNFNNLPLAHWQYGYLVLMLLMVFSVVLPLVFFKRKKWF